MAGIYCAPPTSAAPPTRRLSRPATPTSAASSGCEPFSPAPPASARITRLQVGAYFACDDVGQFRDIRDRDAAVADPANRLGANAAVLISPTRGRRSDPGHLLGFPVVDSSQPVPRHQERGQVFDVLPLPASAFLLCFRRRLSDRFPCGRHAFHSPHGANHRIGVAHLGTGRKVTLPADYAQAHVTLGYAATIDAAQGLTADTCHVVGGDRLSRQLLYVALTRGRAENHLYLSTAEPDPHRILTPKATHPDTAVDVLTRALARDDAQTSATTQTRHARDPFARLGAAADMYYDALGAAAEHLLGPALLADIDNHANTVVPALTRAPAWPVLRKHLAVLAAAGHNPHTMLDDAAAAGDLCDAKDAAAVLDWRIDPTAATPEASGRCAGCPPPPSRCATTRTGVRI
jgi:hypothetical protein